MKLIILTLLLSFSLFALDAKQIMKKVEDAGSGFEGSTAVLKMILTNAHGEKIERQLEATAREEEDGTKSITEFLTPKDVKGTKLLTWAFNDEDNKQWLYLPNLKRVKKINSSNKTSSFMGSEFSYEDISGVDLKAYDFKLDKEDKEFWYITSTPKEKSGYKFIKSKVSKKYTVPVFIQYYDRRGGLLKESVVSDFKKYSHKGKEFNIPSKIVMKNIQTKKKSELIWESRKIGLKIKASQFKSSKLK
jgi:outer membrane lipoprotein-sorting protein